MVYSESWVRKSLPWIALGLFLAAVVGVAVYGAPFTSKKRYCKNLQVQVDSVVEQYQRCNTDRDCVQTGYGAGTCTQCVNTAGKDRVEAIHERFAAESCTLETGLVETCPATQRACVCVQNTCQTDPG